MLDAIEALETDPLAEGTFIRDPMGNSKKINAGFDDLPDLLAIRRRSFSGDVGA